MLKVTLFCLLLMLGFACDESEQRARQKRLDRLEQDVASSEPQKEQAQRRPSSKSGSSSRSNNSSSGRSGSSSSSSRPTQAINRSTSFSFNVSQLMEPNSSLELSCSNHRVNVNAHDDAASAYNFDEACPGGIIYLYLFA